MPYMPSLCLTFFFSAFFDTLNVFAAHKFDRPTVCHNYLCRAKSYRIN